MTQTIDPIKLKAAAEHLEWVLKQYPENEEVRGSLLSLTPLIEHAKTGRISEPCDRDDIPGAYNFGDGLYRPNVHPNIDDAYTIFRIEMRGGLTAQEKRIIERSKAAASE